MAGSDDREVKRDKEGSTPEQGVWSTQQQHHTQASPVPSARCTASCQHSELPAPRAAASSASRSTHLCHVVLVPAVVPPCLWLKQKVACGQLKGHTGQAPDVGRRVVASTQDHLWQAKEGRLAGKRGVRVGTGERVESMTRWVGGWATGLRGQHREGWLMRQKMADERCVWGGVVWGY